jgi:phosphoadenosine phosphosulfate reductase
MVKLEEAKVKELGKEFEGKSAGEVLQWALDTFGEKVALASSFGVEDVVLIEMLYKINPQAKVFTLDTGRLPQETYAVWAQTEKKYMKVEPYFPDTVEVEQMIKKDGPNLFYDSLDKRRLCCNIRKVKPLKRALSKLDAWITGLRREQVVTRTETGKIEWDKGNNIVKINPLADWTEKQTWDYVKTNKIPYNKLHDLNYPSIGCAPCTRPIKPGEDFRAGRWWWESADQKECGLHQ